MTLGMIDSVADPVEPPVVAKLPLDDQVSSLVIEVWTKKGGSLVGCSTSLGSRAGPVSPPNTGSPGGAAGAWGIGGRVPG
jgi:hypothetical protein